jgi:hypothetical protein|tara:strand:+ start:292 stop:714 length:423 start_codon:yes stop_codon:yes gene_type:complete
MEELYLIYVNKIGEDWTGKHLYEFLFSDTTENVDGDDWDAYPASGRPSPPSEGFVKRVGKLVSNELKLKLVQNNSEFAVWDAVDGVVALAWEDMDDYDEYPENRIAIHFGESIKSVEDKLYEHDLVLDYNNISETIKNEN